MRLLSRHALRLPPWNALQVWWRATDWTLGPSCATCSPASKSCCTSRAWSSKVCIWNVPVCDARGSTLYKGCGALRITPLPVGPCLPSPLRGPQPGGGPARTHPSRRAAHLPRRAVHLPGRQGCQQARGQRRSHHAAARRQQVCGTHKAVQVPNLTLGWLSAVEESRLGSLPSSTAPVTARPRPPCHPFPLQI